MEGKGKAGERQERGRRQEAGGRRQELTEEEEEESVKSPTVALSSGGMSVSLKANGCETAPSSSTPAARVATRTS